jgi:putative photosynthetic complex assembly protein 2
MSDTLMPVGMALFCWWFGTGLIFLLERAVRGRRRAAPAVIVAAMALSLWGIRQSTTVATVAGAYLGFACSIGLWGALELSFLTGLVTGTRPAVPCPRHCSGWRHFGHAVMALLYHELALALCALAVAAICWNQPNLTAAWTYLLLWVMRESAKLNLFLGVRNTAVELLPQRLAHLAVYFGKRRANALLPVSIGAAGVIDALLIQQSGAGSVQDRTTDLLLATLLSMAILEHIVLILPVRADLLWTWATRRNAHGRPVADRGFADKRRDDTEPGALRSKTLATRSEESTRQPPLPPGAPA